MQMGTCEGNMQMGTCIEKRVEGNVHRGARRCDYDMNNCDGATRMLYMYMACKGSLCMPVWVL